MRKTLLIIAFAFGYFAFATAGTPNSNLLSKKVYATLVSQVTEQNQGNILNQDHKQQKKKTTKKKSTAVKPDASGSHMKKDGTPDKRFKENKTQKKHLKKDGTPDKRFKENKAKS